jgi:hypothetical protein
MKLAERTMARLTGRRGERALAVAALVGLAASAVLSLAVAPPDAVQGQVQRLMYVHVPAAWLAYLAFGVVFVASVAYLKGGRTRWDRLGAASAEVGVLFTALTIVLGALWGKPVWGTWWTWDPRLTTTAVLLLIYLGYLALRQMADSPAARPRARVSADTPTAPSAGSRPACGIPARYRADLVAARTAEKNRVEKLLEDAQIKLSVVASDIFGVSGRDMLAALIAGERDPKVLARMARTRLRAKTAQLEEAFYGRFSDHHAFLLQTMLGRIDQASADITTVEAKIQEQIAPSAQAVDRLDEICGSAGPPRR